MGAEIRSMTGFGEAAREGARFRVTVTIRAVNYRGLELIFRLPDELRNRESEFRKILGAALIRGRVDIRVGIERVGERTWKVEVRQGILEELQGALAELDHSMVDTAAKLGYGDLLRIPEVVHIEAERDEWTSDDSRLIEAVLQEALEATLEARQAEGAELRSVLARDVERLSKIADSLDVQREVVSNELLGSLRDRVASLLGEATIPEERIVQETALLVEKSDVREEIDRLRAHLRQFATILDAGGAVGRRLNFLCQEILRELNTLGSKCRDSAMITAVLDGKVICEEIREQVQNVE